MATYCYTYETDDGSFDIDIDYTVIKDSTGYVVDTNSLGMCFGSMPLNSRHPVFKSIHELILTDDQIHLDMVNYYFEDLYR